MHTLICVTFSPPSGVGVGCGFCLWLFLDIFIYLFVISSGGVSTVTGFSSMTNVDLYLVVLMEELGFIAAQTSVVRIAASWKGINVVEAV